MNVYTILLYRFYILIETKTAQTHPFKYQFTVFDSTRSLPRVEVYNGWSTIITIAENFQLKSTSSHSIVTSIDFLNVLQDIGISLILQIVEVEG